MSGDMCEAYIDENVYELDNDGVNICSSSNVVTNIYNVF